MNGEPARQNSPRDVEVITTHVNADYDALASMLAAAKLHPEALLVFPGAQERNLRNFFVESTCYFYNFVKVKQVPFEKVRRLILVDTRQKDRIGALAPLADDPEVEVLAYDHHPDSDTDVDAAVAVVEPVGANVTIMTRLLNNAGAELTEDEATLLALGIYEDTGSFTFVSTTPADLEAAAWLVAQGANLQVVSSLITREISAEEVGVLNDLIQDAAKVTVNGLEVVVSEVSRERYVPEFAVLVHKFMDMDNLDALFALARMDHRVYLVARSRLPEVDAGVIAKTLGGGGHPSAASATLKDMTLVEARERLMGVLGAHINPSRTARDLMSSPAISVPPDTTLKEAEGILTRYNVNVMPVVDEAYGEVLGLISRQTVEKAVFHGLGALGVSEYMTPGVTPIGPDASLMEVEQAIVERRQRLVPVVDDGRLIGVVTRTDVLNSIMEHPLIHERLHDDETPQTMHHKDITSLMRERLPREVVALLGELGRVAQRLDQPAYLVGGSVRDLFLRQKNLDLDIVVEGDGIAFAKAVAASRADVRVRAHKKFNTAKLIFADGFTIDVATARLEYYQSPAALPIVELSSLKLDLYRRDFTINTLAVSLAPKEFGRLIDFFDGARDLKEKAIRVLHNLSFVEDPTRVFRAVRFEQRFGFKIGKPTEQLIKNAVRIDAFRRLSGKRLSGELRLMLEEEKPLACLRRLAELKLLAVFHPDLRPEPRDWEFMEQAEEALAWYRLSFLDRPFRQWLYYLMALMDRLDRDKMQRLGRRLALAPRLLNEMEDQRARANMALNRLQRRQPLPSETYFLLEPLKVEYQVFIMAKATRDWAKRAVSSYLTRLSRVRPSLSGDDLKALGFAPGPLFRDILDRLQAACLDGQVTNREEERALVLAEFGHALEETA